jgi:2-oxo-3-hexenedioate decarboxylase
MAEVSDQRAERLLAAIASSAQIAPLSADDPAFDVPAGYRVLADLHARRIAEGWRPIGRKIGFTNTTIWQRYGVDRPMWSHVWDRSVTFANDGEATVALAGLMEPRIEPEVVFGLRAPLPQGSGAMELLKAVEWIASGFEIVHSVFPGWRFAAADCTAAFGLHGRLVVGPKLLVDDANRATLAAALPQFPVTLLRDGVFVESGGGANVLGSPVNALAHLRDLLALQPSSPPLAAGEIVTTGTLTDAWPVAVGETWTSRYGMLGIRGQTLSIS